MSQSNDVNPYTPSPLEPETISKQARRAARVRPVGSLEVCVWTIGVCTAAGSLFGVITFGIFLSASLATGNPEQILGPSLITGLLVVVFYGLVAGGLVAFFGAIPSVLLTFIVSIAVRGTGQSWDRVSIGRFAAFCGLLAGFIPITAISLFDPGAVLVSLVPAVFGCLASRVMIIPLCRKAIDRPKPLSKQPVGH